MSRQTKPSLALLNLYVALLGINLYRLPGRAVCGEAADVPDARSEYKAEQLARARFAAAHADPRELAKEMLAAAESAYAARMQDFLAGRGTLDILLGATRRVQQAELAVLGKDADLAAIAEWRWEQVWEIDKGVEAHYKAQRVAIQDYLQAKYERLDAEIALKRAQIEQANKGRSRLAAPVPLPLLMFSLWMHPPLDSKELAKAKFAVSRANVRELAQARFEAARRMLEARRKGFENGRGTLDILLEASVQTLRSELDVVGQEADPVAAYARHWSLAQQIEAISKDRYDRARIPIQEYAQTKSHRLQAEIWLLQARAKSPGKETSALAGGVASFPLVVDPLSSKELAKAKLEADDGDLRQLHRTRLESARLEHEYRSEDFLVGRGTLDILFSSSQRLLEEELAPSALKASRLTALERYWERALMIEWVNEARSNAGRIPYKEYLESKYFRLEAEIQLIQARLKSKAKDE